MYEKGRFNYREQLQDNTFISGRSFNGLINFLFCIVIVNDQHLVIEDWE